MSELRKDPVTGRWVIISTERRKRPSDFRLESVTIAPDAGCPFCEGHEDMTPRELLAIATAARQTAPAGACASSRISFRCFASRARSIVRVRVSSTR